MAEVISEVVLMIGFGTVRDTHSVKQILNWIATQARRNDGGVTSLAILIALEAIASARFRVLAEGTNCSAYGLGHLEILIDDHISVLFRGGLRAISIAFAHKEFVTRLRAGHAVGLKSTVADFARLMTTDRSNLDVVDFL